MNPSTTPGVRALFLGATILAAGGSAQSTPAPAPAPVPVSPLAVVDTARKAGGNQRIVTTGIRSPQQAAYHALVVTISGYERSPLRGVRVDRRNAEEMAQRFGVPAGNIVHLSEREATREGLQQAVAQLERRVLPGDKVYVFYSGHGARQYEAATGQCAESLVMQNMAVVDHREFMRWLKPVGAKAGKMVVMIDACHSGGVQRGVGVRDLQARAGAPTPKFSEASTPEQCRQPVNLRSITQARGVDLDTTELNYAVLAASRENEVAWDTDEGGAMTTRFMRCVDGEARDLDGSGAVSMGELASCTQTLLDEGLEESIRQHVVVSGNAGLVPGFSVKPPEPAPAPAPPPDPVPPPAPPVVVVNSLAMLEGIHAQRDDRWEVRVEVPKTELRIGTDPLDFRVVSQREGYVYVFYKGTRPESFYLLFPNTLDADNRIRTGESMRLPRAHWTVNPLGPAGTDHLLVMVTETPRDFGQFALPREYVSESGPFTRVTLSPQALAAVGQQALLSEAVNRPECRSPDVQGLRDLGVARRCSHTFGSAMFAVEETP